MVDVHQQQAQRAATAPCAVPLRQQQRVELAAVGNPGQAILARQLVQAGLAFHQVGLQQDAAQAEAQRGHHEATDRQRSRVVDHQRAHHQQQQRQDHRPCSLHGARQPWMRRRARYRRPAQRQQRQQQERQVDQQIVVGTEGIAGGVVVDVVGHQQVRQRVQRQHPEEAAPLGHITGQPAHHREPGDAQVLDIEHALHAGHRRIVDIDTGGERLR
ncbi:hypothetical protein G6F60_013864 [Rhizopus arrhizus]|nr:hypothetical protein G6F60_013864 [Rhizopus arrhizus]